MRRMLWGLLVAGVAVVPARADQTFSCQRDNTVRSVLVSSRPDAAEACEVRYQRVSEGGAPQLLWHAQSDPGFCTGQAAALVQRLQQAGWTCEERMTEAMASPHSVPAALEKPSGITAATKPDPALMKLRPTIH